MNRSYRPIRWGSVLLPLAVTAVALPSAASAATAPTRYVAFTPSGEQPVYPQMVGIAADGSEELLNVTPTRATGSPEAVIFNNAAGTTTPPLPGGAEADGASSDLKKVLFTTDAALDATDKNGAEDLYVLDRTTGKYTLVSRTTAGAASGSETGVISPDGKSVVYAGQSQQPAGTYRYDLTTGAVTQLSSEVMDDTQTLDTAGKVVVTISPDMGVLVGSKFTPLPASAGIPTGAHFYASPDGSAIVALSDVKGAQLITTATGAVRTVTVPSSVTATGFSVLQVANGGGSVVIGSTRGTYPSVVGFVDRVDTTTGAATQIGGDIPSSAGGAPYVATPDLSFAATNTTLIQLGSTPIPGGTGAPAPTINATNYLFFRPGCSSGGVFSPAVKATFQLVGAPVGTDPHVPSSAVVTVYSASGGIVNQSTVKSGARASISPTSGGFNYSAAVTFTDGTTRTGTGTIAAYTPIKNTGNPISDFFDPSACYSANR